MMTQTEMVSTFPEGLKQALLDFGAVESKTTNELHEFLTRIREEMDIPPWHPFTLYIKEAARGIGCIGYAYSKNNLWFNFTKGREDDLYEIPTQNPIVRDWVYVKISLQTNGEVVGSMPLVVQPSTQRIWSLSTESLVSDGIYINLRVPGSDRHTSHTRIKKEVILEKASEALRAGNMRIEIQSTYKPRAAKEQASVEEKPIATKKTAKSLYIIEAFIKEKVLHTGNTTDVLFVEDLYKAFIDSDYYSGVGGEHSIRIGLGKAMVAVYRAQKRRDVKGADGKAKYSYVGYKLLPKCAVQQPEPNRADTLFNAVKPFVPLSKEEVAYLCVLLDMGRHKALELGMEDTLHQWETIVQKLKDLYG